VTLVRLLHLRYTWEAALMAQTIKAIIDQDGSVRLLESVQLPPGRRALVTVLDEAGVVADETALLSEGALATDWNRPEEDAAWAHLQRAR
jgi:hypothetical protein